MLNISGRPSENTLGNVLNFIAKGIESISGVTILIPSKRGVSRKA